MPFRPVIIAAAQAAVLYTAGVRVPLLGQIALLFVPVPLIIVTVLQGRRSGLAALAIATLLVSLLGAWQTTAIFFLIGFGFMAMLLAEGMLRDGNPEATVAAGGIIPLLALGAVLGLLLLKAGKDPTVMIEEYLHTAVSDTQKIYSAMGVTDAAQMLAALADRIVYYAVRLLPGIALATGLMQAAGCYGIARSFVRRSRPDLPAASRPPLALWHAPDIWVWGLIAALVMTAMTDRTMFFIGLNLAIIYILVYSAQGVAIVEFYFLKARIPAATRTILHTLILTMPTVVAVISLGVVDVWADVRKVRGPQTPL